MNEKAIAIVSGGLDSVTMAYDLAEEGYDLEFVCFDYGQRHRRETELSRWHAKQIGAPFHLIDITSIGAHLKGSALTDDIDVPAGNYDEPSMRITVVPNRNAIFLAIAYGIAVAQNATMVATAVHAGDHFIYPDCRPAFIESFDAMQRTAVEGFGHPDLRLNAPYLRLTKAEIVALGSILNVPFNETWSCYVGGVNHCGVCGTCRERQEAFRLAGVFDPTVYEQFVD